MFGRNNRTPYPRPMSPRVANTAMGTNPWIEDFVNEGISLPALNIKESKNKFELEVVAPGMEKEDFNITVENGLMTIAGQKKEEQSSDEENITYQEYSFSSFSRTFQVPEQMDDENISAFYKNGILKIEIPKKELKPMKAPKLIPIS